MIANTALAEVDRFASWRAALAGEKPGIHDGEPWCGYFKMRDRRHDADLPKGAQRPWVACAIWVDWRGNLVAEIDGDPTSPDFLWPFVAKNPIGFEEYTKLHEERSA